MRLLGGDNIAENLKDSLDEVSLVEFGETMKTRDLVGKTFTIHGVRTVSTQYGESHVGEIDLEGTPCEAWLSGVILSKQLTEVLIEKLPVTVTLVRDTNLNGEPFRFTSL